MKKLIITVLICGIVLHVAGFFLLLLFANSSEELIASFSFGVFIVGFALVFLSGFISLGCLCVRQSFGFWNYLLVIAAGVGGACIWIFSRKFTGSKEPWDSPWGYHYYFGTTIALGLVSGLAVPRGWVVSAAAIIIGQLVVSRFGLSMFGTLGTFAIFYFSIPAVAATVVGASIVDRRAIGFGKG